MAKRTATILFATALCLSTVASARPALSGPEDITVPTGYKLIEIPAEYKIATKPVELKTVESFEMVPGIYRHAIVNGVRRREIVRAPVRAERLIIGPLRTETVRVITYPTSYILHDENGRIVSRFRWVRGQLIEI